MTLAQAARLAPRLAPELQLTAAYRLRPVAAAMLGLLHVPWTGSRLAADPFPYTSGIGAGVGLPTASPIIWVVPVESLPPFSSEADNLTPYRAAFIPIALATTAFLLHTFQDSIIAPVGD